MITYLWLKNNRNCITDPFLLKNVLDESWYIGVQDVTGKTLIFNKEQFNNGILSANIKMLEQGKGTVNFSRAIEGISREKFVEINSEEYS